MHTRFVRHVSLPLYHWWHGSDLLKNIRKFQESQWFAQERLQAMQWERLSRLLNHAYRHVPYYQDTFREIGAEPGDFRSLKDFAKFPTVTKRILQERLADLTASNITRAELVKGVTSGSSGQPTHYIQEKSSNRIRTAAGKRLTGIAGYDLGQKLFYLWRDSPFIIEGDQVRLATEVQKRPSSVLGKFKQAIHSRFGVENQTLRVDPTLMTESEMANMYEQLRLFKPDVVISYVSTLYMFAQYLDSNRLVGEIAPRSVIVSSETLYPYQRELLERVFRCSVYNRYGLSETGIVAIECPVRQGLHLNQEILHMESVPDLAGSSQLVVTDLINHGMPLLRYETGDSGRVIEERCACGRGLSRIVDLSGRIIDLLPTRMGGYVNGQLFATFHWIEGVKQYQVIQEKLDAFKIRIVQTPAFVETNLTPMIEIIRKRFGGDTSIAVEYVESIPFTRGGKYKLVVSEVKTQEVQ